VRSMGAGVGREHPVAIVRMQRADEEVRIVAPLRDRVAEQGLDLATREDVRAALVQSIHVDHERQLLDERAVTTLDLASLAVRRRSDCRAFHAAVHQTEIGPNGPAAVTQKGDLRVQDGIQASITSIQVQPTTAQRRPAKRIQRRPSRAAIRTSRAIQTPTIPQSRARATEASVMKSAL